MQPSIYRPTVITVDRQAIRENFLNERKLLKPNVSMFAVLKANAYGHGVIEVAQTLDREGVDGFCVATLDEGLELRNHGFQEPILVLGITPVEEALIAAKADISLTVATLDWLKEADRILTSPVKVHLACDTGMGRIGFLDRDAIVEACNFINTTDKIDPEGIFTHFSTADANDEKSVAHFNEQVATFKEMTRDLPVDFKYIHCANTATGLWHLNNLGCPTNIVRFGIGLYGLNPSGTAIKELPYELKPAMKIESEIVYTKVEPAGKKISYGATYTTHKDEIIATLPIGYADGWLRRMSGSEVLIDGKRCPIVGRVCMDQLMVRLPKMYPIGTKVTLMGKNGADQITAEELADYAGTINYEILCEMSDRVPRKYVN